jgi:GNAT superfamily N-acetyltransferase
MFHPIARTIEELAANAWPAAVTQAVDGWRLRFNWGVTSRANSVWPNDSGGAVPLGEKIAEAESFYARRGLPSCFQISPAAQPAELDGMLARRGYGLRSPTSVQTASIDEIAQRTAGRPRAEIALRDAPDQAWSDTYARAGAMSDHEQRMRRGILERIGPRAAYALARLDGQPAAVGLGVLERGWLGVFCMETLPEMRRRGAAVSILAALADWAREGGAAFAYLQVVEANAPAAGLYARAGFAAQYRYHYRVATTIAV